jgi:hypothetical protein
VVVRHPLFWSSLTWCLLAAPAHAQPKGEEGVRADLGARGGFSVPFGKGGANATENLNQSVAAVVPLWVELGVRVIPQLTLGAFGSYGTAILGDTLDGVCEANSLACSATQLRAGAEARFHPLAYQTYDPWIGLGVGYESLTFSFDSTQHSIVQPAQRGELTLKGFQLINIQGGIDFKVSRRSDVTVGMFVDFAIAEYSDVSCFGTVVCTSAINKTTHQWLTFGVRTAIVP